MKVLIADDHMLVRNGLKQVINEQSDMEVVAEAADGSEAFMKLENHSVDLALIDVSMPPGENGLQTARRMKEVRPKLKIIMLTMYDEFNYLQEAFSSNIEGFVVKSEPNQVLLSALRTVAAGNKYYSGIGEEQLQSLTLTNRDEGYQKLTKREKELLPLIALGYSNKEIAAQLFLSVKTVEVHKTKIRKKLDVTHYADLLRYCVKHHLIDF